MVKDVTKVSQMPIWGVGVCLTVCMCVCVCVCVQCFIHNFKFWEGVNPVRY